MVKKLYDLLIAYVEHKLESVRYEIIGSEKRRTDKRTTDPLDGTERMVAEDSVRLEVEIPRGNGMFSRVRIKVKLLIDDFPISDTDLEEEIFTCIFRNLKITYIASTNDHTVYFKADGCRIYRNDDIDIFKEI